MSLIEADQSETFLKLSLEEAQLYAGFVLLFDHPLLLYVNVSLT